MSVVTISRMRPSRNICMRSRRSSLGTLRTMSPTLSKLCVVARRSARTAAVPPSLQKTMVFELMR